MARERLASLISGGGTTMEQMVLACQRGEVPMDVACVIGSNARAGGIRKAQSLGIPTIIINPNTFRDSNGEVDQEWFGHNLLGALKAFDVSVVTQNGWLPKTPTNVIDQYAETIFNQHPGPLPEFGGQGMYGRRVHAARLFYYDAVGRHDPFTEATTHRVTENFDEGPLVGIRCVPIFENDRVETLQERVLPEEHALQIELLKQIASGTVTEIPRTHRPSLILPGEESILDRAKKAAIELFPKG